MDPFGRPQGGSPFDIFNQMEQNMNQMMQGMFNDPFGGQGNQMPGMMGMPGFPGMPGMPGFHNMQQQLPSIEDQRRQQIRNQAPIISEVDQEDDQASHRVSRNQTQPIVEEPGQERHQQCSGHPYQQQQSNNYNQSMMAPGDGGMGMGMGMDMGMGGFGGLGFPGFGSMMQMANQPGVQTYSYSSSSFQASGPDGVQYVQKRSNRTGPGGVYEAHQAVHDGRTGQESVSVQRGVGDRGRTMTRTRNRDGDEQTQRILHNIEPEQMEQFDQEWQHVARQNLPGAQRNRQRIQNQQSSQYQIREQ